MSQPQTQPVAKSIATPLEAPRILRVDLLEVISVADATAASFSTDLSALGSAKAAAGFSISIVRMGPDGMTIPLKSGETWDGVRLTKSLHDRIRNVRQTYSAFVPKENVREVVYSPE